MTKRDSTLETVTPQALRQSIVGYVPDTYRHPQIKLKGKWLEQAGFTTGTPLTVRVMDGCLVITSKPQPSLMDTMLQPAEQLSEERQQELATMIEAMLLREQLGGLR